MKIEEHAKNLGGLILNLHSLEFLLRACLGRLPGAPAYGLPWGTSIYTLPVGSSAPLNDFTSYETLGQLIERYNREVTARNIGTAIDPSLVDLRDAIAHGRVSTGKEDTPLTLIKFSKPKGGFVNVTVNFVMDEAWFKMSRDRVKNALFAVHTALEKLPRPTPPT